MHGPCACRNTPRFVVYPLNLKNVNWNIRHTVAFADLKRVISKLCSFKSSRPTVPWEGIPLSSANFKRPSCSEIRFRLGLLFVIMRAICDRFEFWTGILTIVMLLSNSVSYNLDANLNSSHTFCISIFHRILSSNNVCFPLLIFRIHDRVAPSLMLSPL